MVWCGAAPPLRKCDKNLLSMASLSHRYKVKPSTQLRWGISPWLGVNCPQGEDVPGQAAVPQRPRDSDCWLSRSLSNRDVFSRSFQIITLSLYAGAGAGESMGHSAECWHPFLSIPDQLCDLGTVLEQVKVPGASWIKQVPRAHAPRQRSDTSSLKNIPAPVCAP